MPDVNLLAHPGHSIFWGEFSS